MRFGLKLSILIALIAVLALTGCDTGNGGGSAPADKSALQTALTAATAAKNGATPGIYWVITADLTTFETAITAAQTVNDNAAATQAEVDSAETTLLDATTDYTGQKHDAGTDPLTVLTAINTAYATGTGSLGTTASPTPVTIIVSGTIAWTSGGGSAWLGITGADAYPPIALQGAAGGGTLNAADSIRVLFINNGNKVTLGAKLTLTGGSSSRGSGGGVYVSSTSTFNMEGGTISGNTAQTTGGGVYLENGATFTKTGGTIYGNTGTATANTATDGLSGHYGHAVYWASSPAKKVDTDVTGPLSTASNTGWTAIP